MSAGYQFRDEDIQPGKDPVELKPAPLNMMVSMGLSRAPYLSYKNNQLMTPGNSPDIKK
jgi:hypothetical protein